MIMIMIMIRIRIIIMMTNMIVGRQPESNS